MINFEVKKTRIETKSRKLSTQWIAEELPELLTMPATPNHPYPELQDAVERAVEYFFDNHFESKPSHGFDEYMESYRTQLRNWFKKEYRAYIKFDEPEFFDSTTYIKHIPEEELILFKLRWC
jgi:hypothetical protein